MDVPNHRILVIDDDSTCRDAVADVLREEGYRVETAQDGQEGLDAFARFQPHLVLTDLQMPRLGGLGVLAHVRKVAASVPVMILTASASEDAAREARRLEVDDYLVKPLDLDMILERVARNLSANR